jgi:hypothetical protein
MHKRIRKVISECQFELATNFDVPAISIVSHHAARLGMTIYGKRFLAHPENTGNLEEQTYFFNRSLKQLTQEIQCPELYFFRHGKWIPNPHTPLAWAQANLSLALEFMKRSATLATRRPPCPPGLRHDS